MMLAALLKKRSRQQKGFSLIELLIVVAIILIIVSIAIPNFNKTMKQAHETAAIKSLQTIATAEVMYQSTYPASGFACSLEQLGGNANVSSPTSAGLINDTQLLAGAKNGYTFKITNCTTANGGGGNSTNTSYQVFASPQTPGKSGDRYFCSDVSGTVHYNPTANCNPATDPSL